MEAAKAETGTRHTRPSPRGVVLITGSSGFLGRALGERLADRFDVVGFDARLPLAALEHAESIQVDLTSDASVTAALRRIRARYGTRIASVIHLAGYYDLSGDPSPLYDKVTVEGTARLLRELRDFEVEQFVFASTLLVHAPSDPGQRIDEDSPLDPKTPYPQSKLDTEAVVREQRGDIPVAILRLAGIYDEQCRAVFIAHQIANIYERVPVSYVYPGDPESGQPYLHLDDFADAVEALIDRRKALPAEVTLLLGESETMSYADLQTEIGRLIHGEAWETTQIPKTLAKAGQWLQEDVLDVDPFVQPWMIEQASDHYELDISRAKDLIEWSPQRSLGQTLPAMIAALEADPAAWYAANKLNPAPVAAADTALDKAEARARQRAEEALPRTIENLELRYRETNWAHYVNTALGAWLIVSPFTFGLFDPVPAATLPPAAGHDLAGPEQRNLWLGISEIISGIAVVILSMLSLSGRRPWAPWMTTVVGAWLLLAPLVFWTTSASAYGNDTLVGMLVIVFAVMVPPQPGISPEALSTDGDVPLGWTYSPSSLAQRVPIVALAFIGLFVSRYLAAYQMGHVESVWDPFFSGTTGSENGTATVITSEVSRAFPIADAGLGAFAYALDILTGAAGDRRRWRTMPWLVLIFGLLVIPLGLVSIAFIVIQPTIIGALCTLCLVQAAVTLILIPYAIDEVLATVQFLAQSRRVGRPFWATLFKGGPGLDERQDQGPDLASLGTVIREFLSGGVTYPWTLVLSIAIGIWLIAAPLIGISTPPLAWSDHILGCVVITIAVTALAEIARPARFLNVLCGLWLAASPFVLAGATTGAMIGNIAAGIALVLLSLPRGKLSGAHYGSWDRFIV